MKQINKIAWIPIIGMFAVTYDFFFIGKWFNEKSDTFCMMYGVYQGIGSTLILGFIL